MTTVKGRDLRYNIRLLGFEKGVVATLELLLDEMAGHRQAMKEMAELQSNMIDRLTEVIQIGGSMAVKMKEFDRTTNQYAYTPIPGTDVDG